MEQLKLFIEKAKTDAGLLAKLDELGMQQDAAEKISQLGGENGFTFTADDVAGYMSGSKRTGQMNEEELEQVAGGGWGLSLCIYSTEFLAGRIKTIKQEGPVFLGLCSQRGKTVCTFFGCRCWGKDVCKNGWHKCEPDGHWQVGHGWD